MDGIPDISPLLWGNLLAIALLLALAWRPRSRSVGLPACYLLSLATIHLVGAWVSTLPACTTENSLAAAIGFRECFAGVLAFVVGVIGVECLLAAKRSWLPPRVGPAAGKATDPHHRAASNKTPIPGQGRARTPAAYVLLGVLCTLCSPLVSAIPSLAALAHCGAYLTVAGFCLGCFQAWRGGYRVTLLVWAGATFLFPLFTVLTSGFIGYGIFAALMVLSFALVFYRPRWQAVLALAVLAYLALSTYVTYMRDRDQMREAVWGGQNYSARIVRLEEILARFEFFQPGDERQLQAIDDRLNQNFFVGTAQAQLETGVVAWANGSTLWRALQAVVPRILWPDKPVVAGSGNLVSEFTGLSFADGTSVGVGQVLEFYINFGRTGVILGFLCFGFVLRFLDWRAARSLHQGDYGGFVLWYLPGLAFMQTGGSLVEVSGTCAASLALVYAVNRFAIPIALPLLAGRDRRSVGRKLLFTRS